MKKITILNFVLLGLMVSTSVKGQRYFSRTGNVTFLSETPIENIEATTSNATVVMDLSSMKIESAVLIKSFHFKKALMEEHFNENYMESSKYPKATFKGSIDGVPAELEEGKEYECTVSGGLTIHGENQDIDAPCTIIIMDGEIISSSTFSVSPGDYGIEIPALVRENIAKSIKIKITANLAKLKS